MDIDLKNRGISFDSTDVEPENEDGVKRVGKTSQCLHSRSCM